MNAIYSKRRDRFFKAMAEHAGCDAIAVVPAQPEIYRNDDVPFKFRQDSNFHYLTGFEEPESIAVFRNIKGKKDFIVFVRPKILEKEIWTGYRLGVDAAAKALGADAAHSEEDFDKVFPDLLKGSEKIYYSFHRTHLRNGVEHFDTKILRHLDQYRTSLGRTGRGLIPMLDAKELIGEMRIYKTSDEIDSLRRAGKLSAKAHLEAMARSRPGLYEYQIEALLEYVFKNGGSPRPGYNSIVASGENATILHYVENNRKMEKDELLLIDAGTEWNYLTADITRTFPVSGKYSKAQKEIYQIVLDVQEECLRMAKPGATLLAIHTFATKELAKAAIALGFVKGPLEKAIKSLEYKRYYPHGTGHLLGMDVHDVGCYYIDGEPRKLQPGMVFTVEPGFYILRDDKHAPAGYRGIGVRIEDDVVITERGHEVLTADVPKDIKEVCDIIGTKPWPQI